MYGCLLVHVHMYARHGVCRRQKTTLWMEWNQFSPSTLIWVPGIELGCQLVQQLIWTVQPFRCFTVIFSVAGFLPETEAAYAAQVSRELICTSYI